MASPEHFRDSNTVIFFLCESFFQNEFILSFFILVGDFHSPLQTSVHRFIHSCYLNVASPGAWMFSSQFITISYPGGIKLEKMEQPTRKLTLVACANDMLPLYTGLPGCGNQEHNQWDYSGMRITHMNNGCRIGPWMIIMGNNWNAYFVVQWKAFKCSQKESDFLDLCT